MASWTKKVLRLTNEQKQRGVVFSSALCLKGEREDETIHEVIPANDSDWQGTIERLKNVSFFKSMAADMGWDVTEIVRR